MTTDATTPSIPSCASRPGATRIGVPLELPAIAGGVLTSVYTLPPRTNKIAMNMRPNMTVSGGLVGILNLGLESLTLGRRIILGHQARIVLPQGFEFVSAFKSIEKSITVLAAKLRNVRCVFKTPEFILRERKDREAKSIVPIDGSYRKTNSGREDCYCS
jgi:hypothetical protein